MELSLRFSGNLFGVPESLEPLVQESEDGCFGHNSGRLDLVSCGPQCGLSCDASQCLSFTELGAESANFLSKNEIQVRPGNARLLPGALDLGRDVKQASTLRWAHSEDYLKNAIKLLVFDEDDEAESEGSLWLSEESDHEDNPRGVCTFRGSRNGVSTHTTMSPHSAAWAITTRTQGGDEGSKEENHSQSENQTHDTPQQSNAPQNSQVRKRSNQEDDQEDSAGGESADDNAIKKSRSTSSEELRLACPFNKMDPFKYGIRNGLGKKDKYRVCAGPGFSSIHRLREHLQRVHRPDQCLQCFSTFGNEKELLDHMSSPSVCQRNPESQREGIENYKWEMICTRGRKNQTNFERWYKIWDILFPDKPRPSHCFYTEYNDKTLDPDRLVAIFKEKIELDISRGFIKVQDALRENAQGAQDQLVGWIIQALRDTIATPEAYHRLHLSEGIPSTSASDPIGSERAGSSKPQSVDLAVSWLDPKSRPANAPVPFSELGSSSEIASFYPYLFSQELPRPAFEILQPATSSKTPDYPTSTALNRPCSWEAAHPEAMTSTTSVSEQGTHLQQSFPSGHDVATEEQLEGSSGSNNLPMDVGLEISPSQSIAARPFGSLTLHNCSSCTKRFTRASDLARHRKIHDLPCFSCPVAGCSRSGGVRGFYRRDKLRDHMRKKHPRDAENYLDNA